MLIDINNLDDGRSIKVFFAEKLSIPTEYRLEGDTLDAEVEASITKDGNIYKLEGMLSAKAVFQCAKCLTPVAYLLKVEIEETFSNAVDGDNTENNEIWMFKGTEIDITPAVLSNVLLGIPYRVLCGEACKGLCPVCGCNLNKEECSCDRSPRDIRFEGLKSLFDNEEV